MGLPDVLKNVAPNLSVPEKVVGGLAVAGVIVAAAKMFDLKFIHVDPESGLPYVKDGDTRLDPRTRLPVDTRTGYFLID